MPSGVVRVSVSSGRSPRSRAARAAQSARVCFAKAATLAPRPCRESSIAAPSRARLCEGRHGRTPAALLGEGGARAPVRLDWNNRMAAPPDDAIPYGPALRRHFLLEDGVVFLNHGSFGATPRPVLAAQDDWRRRMEAQPGRFMSRELPRLLRHAAADP